MWSAVTLARPPLPPSRAGTAAAAAAACAAHGRPARHAGPFPRGRQTLGAVHRHGLDAGLSTHASGRVAGAPGRRTSPQDSAPFGVLARPRCGATWARRFLASGAANGDDVPDAIVVGVYESSSGSPGEDDADRPCELANDSLYEEYPELAAKLSGAAAECRLGIRGGAGKVSVVYELGQGAAGKVAVVGLGRRPAPGDVSPGVREAIRKAASAGVRALREHKARNVLVDPLGCPHSAGEGVGLGLYTFDELKSKQPSSQVSAGPLRAADGPSWRTGMLYAEAQNFARRITEMPSNLATPELFAETVAKAVGGLQGVEVFVRDETWIRERNMRLLLSVAAGSTRPPRFVEIRYRGGGGGGGDGSPLALVGKGVTFDSGGISIKPSANMAAMKGDMGGAASVAGAMMAAAKLCLPLDVVALLPMTENMPSGTATKPGDVVVASNGKSVEVDNTDAEGRLILADALVHACKEYKPSVVVDVATLTGAMAVALGPAFSGVFCTSDTLWERLRLAGLRTGDRFWRMPFDDVYTKMTSKSTVADLVNSAGREGGACTAAAFLREFVSPLPKSSSGEGVLDQNTAADGDESEAAERFVSYAHVDIAGTMHSSNSEGYQFQGMSGRPTRALIEFMRQSAQEGWLGR